MKRLLKRMLMILLAISLLLPLFPVQSVFADEINYPFEIDVLTKNDYSFTGKFLSYNDTIYASADTLGQIDSVDYNDLANGGKTFFRTDTEKGKINIEANEIREYDGVQYFPLLDILVELCLDAAVHKSDGYVTIEPIKSVWSLADEMKSMMTNQLYHVAPWRYSELVNANEAKLLSVFSDIASNLFVAPKYALGFAYYEAYQNAIIKIMLPAFDSVYMSDDFFEMYSTSLSSIGFYLGKTAELQDVSSKDLYERVSAKVSKETMPLFAKVIEYAGLAIEMVDPKDALKFIALLYNVSSIEEPVMRGLTTLSYQTNLFETNIVLSSALFDLLEYCEGKQSFTEIFASEVKKNGMTAIVKKAMGGDVTDFILNLAKLFLKDYGDVSRTVDKIGEAYSNLIIQDEVMRSSYKQALQRLNNAETLEDKEKRISDLRDIVLVYMLAGHNCWKLLGEIGGADYSEDMKIQIQRMLNFGDREFKIVEISKRAVDDFKSFANAQDVYTFIYEEGAEVNFTIDGTASNGEKLTERMFGGYEMSNGSKAVQVSQKNSSTWISVYDTEGKYEVVVTPSGSSNSVKDTPMSIEIAFQKQEVNWDHYLAKDENGKEIYRIPLPLGSGAATPEPEEAVSNQDGRYVLYGKWNYYTYGFEPSKVSVQQSVNEEATLSYLDQQGNKTMEMRVGTLPDYTDFEEMTDLIFDYLKKEKNATGLSMNSHKVKLENNIEVEVGVVTFNESKIPVYYFATTQPFAYNIYGMSTYVAEKTEAKFDDFLLDGVKYLDALTLQGDSNVLEVRTRDHLYRITFDASKVWLRGSSSFGYFSGYAAENHDDQCQSYDIDNYYASFDEYYQMIVNAYCQEEGELFDGVMGETVKTTIAGYPAYFFDVTYRDIKDPDQQFHSEFFFLDLENGSNIIGAGGSEEHFAKYNLSYEQFVQSAFQKIEIVK